MLINRVIEGKHREHKMKFKKGKPTKKSEFGITIQKSLSANIKSNSLRFFTNEMKMIAQLRYNQARNILLKQEKVIREEQESYINESELKREVDFQTMSINTRRRTSKKERDTNDYINFIIN